MRQALLYAVDRSSLADRVYFKQAEVASELRKMSRPTAARSCAPCPGPVLDGPPLHRIPNRYFSLGSKASRTPLPKTLAASTVAKMQKPGRKTNQGECTK